MRTPNAPLWSAIALALLVSCGDGKPAASPEPAGPSSAAPSAGPAPSAAPAASSAATPTPAPPASAPPAANEQKFASLPKEKKVEIMTTKVIPTLGKSFKEHDAKKFGGFGCATCHGPKKDQDPHAVLPKLTLSSGGFEKLAKQKPEMMKFMGDKVVPEMAAALGEKPFDPATKQGFGCGGCHTVN